MSHLKEFMLAITGMTVAMAAWAGDQERSPSISSISRFCVGVRYEEQAQQSPKCPLVIVTENFTVSAEVRVSEELALQDLDRQCANGFWPKGTKDIFLANSIQTTYVKDKHSGELKQVLLEPNLVRGCERPGPK